tara:strand:+ start:942 stop:2303 length:1362 start_codon:yes stop_codon:yes gene_type:complete
MKKTFIILSLVGFICFVGLWTIVSGGYDKQNTTILFLKKFIPTSISRKIRDTIFIIPDLKEQNRILSVQVAKYEQGLDGNLFEEIEQKSKEGLYSYNLKKFFLPFKRLDQRAGWQAEKNSRRAHYLEIIDDKILSISGLGETIYFNKNNINRNKLNQKKITNNLKKILKTKNSELLGIRDLYYENNYIYISLIERDSRGATINIYKAKKNFKNLDFELFFETFEYRKKYTLQTGGRIEKFKDNKILFSIGFFDNYDGAQKNDNLVGKIISIDKNTKSFNLVSIGHRNPQGLSFLKNNNLIINTEHGPKGGDEINLNFLSDEKLKNFGWPISSYGKPYPGTEKIYQEKGLLKSTHAENGFEEPIKYFVPSIGISELVAIEDNSQENLQNTIYASSLRANSIYIIKVNKNFKKILNVDRIYISNNRIRDLKYDEESNNFFLILENVPGIGVIKIS